MYDITAVFNVSSIHVPSVSMLYIFMCACVSVCLAVCVPYIVYAMCSTFDIDAVFNVSFVYSLFMSMLYIFIQYVRECVPVSVCC